MTGLFRDYPHISFSVAHKNSQVQVTSDLSYNPAMDFNDFKFNIKFDNRNVNHSMEGKGLYHARKINGQQKTWMQAKVNKQDFLQVFQCSGIGKM